MHNHHYIDDLPSSAGDYTLSLMPMDMLDYSVEGLIDRISRDPVRLSALDQCKHARQLSENIQSKGGIAKALDL